MLMDYCYELDIDVYFLKVFGVDSEDASTEKADENMGTRKTDASVGKLLDTVSDDQPLSRWIDGMHSPIPIQNPGKSSFKQIIMGNYKFDTFKCDLLQTLPLFHVYPELLYIS